MVYASYHGLIALIFLIMGVWTLRQTGWRETCVLIRVKQNNNSEISKDAIQPDTADVQGAEVFSLSHSDTVMLRVKASGLHKIY